MDNSTTLKSKMPLWGGLVLVLLCGVFLLVFKPLFNLIFAYASSPNSAPEIHIRADEIPVYPNGEIVSVTQNEPSENNSGIVSTWIFTTIDNPDVVWKFYVDEMGRKWGFYEWPLTESPLHLTIVSCPTNNLYMTSSLIDNLTYQVTIQFVIGGCY